MMNQINSINPIEVVASDETVAKTLEILQRHNAMQIKRISAFGMSLLQCEIAAADTPALLNDCANCGVDAYIR